jgi:hypothetical protein
MEISSFCVFTHLGPEADTQLLDFRPPAGLVAASLLKSCDPSQLLIAYEKVFLKSFMSLVKSAHNFRGVQVCFNCDVNIIGLNRSIFKSEGSMSQCT